MVSLKAVTESNALIKSSIPPGQVSLWVGATSGIAGHTLTEYVRHANAPKVYIVGRGATKMSTIIADLTALNPQGQYTPIMAEIALLKNVVAASDEFKRQEKTLDLLVMCPGYLKLSRVDNADGLEETLSLRYYVRLLFINSLLPLLTAVPNARVVNIHGAGREAPLIEDDLELRTHYSLINAAKHSTTMTTLSLRELAAVHTSISFLHVFPGVVVTPSFGKFSEDWWFPFKWFLGWFSGLRIVQRLFTVSQEESGQRNLYHATSARYPPGEVRGEGAGASAGAGVKLGQGVEVAKGADWKVGSGCYLLDWNGETTGDRKLLDEFAKKETGKKVWEHTLEVFDRVLKRSETGAAGAGAGAGGATTTATG